ncbi:DUF6776 family protein [Ectothiorhodospira lacustris]|uniref:DUF6776 family protein n=1 Tax=Ectothiorhodospira lacustris TaxID=2899127 RepID=UPI001EE94F14|nr:DUF6776 family protein [Ectothiorhodospira lacustris]MCG5500852.1 hypothetical protein [Ectothiorhodospira lacustris]MCG5510633.1 hypothetical protein [Ectothiorhodospira lacustris]MCG5521325.1 hypothetical protein [Ectothiorhodospira lacustris]
MVRRRVHAGYHHAGQWRPWQLFLVAVTLLGGLLLAGWQSYRLGYDHGLLYGQDTDLQIAELGPRYKDLETAHRRLRQRHAALERDLMIEREASARVRSSIHEMEQRIYHLTEELDFYRNIISPEDLERGLHIQRVRLEPDPEHHGHYFYQVVLTQVQGSQVVEGILRLGLEGRNAGEQVRYDHAAISPDQARGRGFSFRYFQVLDGRLVLPEHLLPERLIIQAEPGGGGLRATEQSLPWQSLFNLSGGSP